MMEKLHFDQHTQFQSNRIYVRNTDTDINVFPSDAQTVTEKAYFCVEGLDAFPTAFLIKDKENITLDFSNATLRLHGLMQPLIFDSCSNVTLRNLTIEYDRANMTEMTVTDVGEGFLKVRVSPGFPYRIEDGQFIPYGEYFEDRTVSGSALFLQEFDGKTHRGVSWPVVAIGRNANTNEEIPWLSNVPVLIPEQSGDEVIFRGTNIPPYHIGNTLVLAHGNRCLSAVSIFNCKDFHLENVRIINGIGMGILPNYTENLYIDDLRMLHDEKSKGVAANNADGIHATSCKGDFVIRNSTINHTIDDAINIHVDWYGLE